MTPWVRRGQTSGKGKGGKGSPGERPPPHVLDSQRVVAEWQREQAAKQRRDKQEQREVTPPPLLYRSHSPPFRLR